MTRALRIVHRNALVYRRAWRGSVFSSFLQPTLFLLAMGLGVGGMVEDDSAAIGGMSFLEFLAPGLLAAACMQTAASESSWPVLGRFRWERSYHAMIATPLTVPELVVGELVWVAARVTVVGTAFALVATAFGALPPAAIAPAVAAGVLTGLAFSGPVLAYAPTVRVNGNFNALFRFVITPLFLFSGVFVPVDRLPVPLPLVAWVTPLFHGVELVRAAARGTSPEAGVAVHVMVLMLFLVCGALVARGTFRRRLLA